MIEILVPELGAAADDVVTVSCWLVSVGDEVVEGDRIVELLVGEVTFDVASPASGRLMETAYEADDTVEQGAVLGWLQPDSDEE